MPLAGLAVKVTNGYFLIGLSAAEVDVQRNIEMLKQRDWLDIPIVYTSGKRAILAIEKGTPGQRAFDGSVPGVGRINSAVVPAQADDPVNTDSAVMTGLPAFAGNDSRM